MRKQLYLLYLLLLSVQLAIAQTARYEYWLDNDYDTRVTSTNVYEDVTLDVDVSSKKPGLHYFSFRAQSTNGQWGGMSRYYFFIRESADDDASSMTRYEYWLDKDYEHRTVVNGEASKIPLALDISSLKPGLHYLTFRAQGKSGQWGGLSRFYFFIRESADDGVYMTKYEYWLDKDYEHRTIVNGEASEIPLTLDISSLKPGLHYFTFRAQGKSGQWGGLSRYYFFIRESAYDGTSYMAKYEYWLDKDYEHRTVVNGEASEIPLTLDLSSLKPGLHYFNIRAQGRTGQWGALSRYLVYLSEAMSNVNLSSVEYMIDNDSTNVQSQPVNGNTIVISADISRLSEGTHTINIEGITNNFTRCLLGNYEFVYDDIPQPEAVFENGVLTIGGNTTMTEAVEYVGGQSVVAERVAAVVWNSSAELTNSDLQGITNPNLLVYVNDASLAPSNVQNVVINGLAREIVLTDAQDGNNDWYAPQAFVAERISYTRNFAQSTTKGTSRGWESIALPFDVQTIQHESKGVIAPFYNQASNKHFWLRRLTENGLQAATGIEANTPYVISMPNSEEYTDEFNLAGLITFSSQNAQVPATVTNTLALADSSIVMVPAMQRKERSSAVWALNVGEVRGQYFEGSVFERDYRTVRPFEAYTVHRLENSQPAPRYIPIQEIGGTTGIDASLVNREEVNNEEWYDLEGRKLQGQPKQKGVYISKGKKVVVK